MKYLLQSASNLKTRIRCCLNCNVGSILVVIRKKSDTIDTMKYLNVAEKNDAAKNIALHLSRGTSRRVIKLTIVLNYSVVEAYSPTSLQFTIVA